MNPMENYGDTEISVPIAESEIEKMINSDVNCLMLWDASGMIVDWSIAALGFFGAVSKESLHKNIYELSPRYQPDGKLSETAILEWIKHALKHGTASFDWLCKKLDGRHADCRIDMYAGEYRGQKIVCAFILERFAENAERIAQERLRYVLNSSPMVCAIFDEDANILEVSQSSTDVFEISDKSVYIERFHDLNPEFQPDGTPSRVQVARNLKQAMDDGYAHVEWMHQKLDGTPIPCKVHIRYVQFDGRNVFIAYTQDLREHKEMIAQIEAAREKEMEQALIRAEMEKEREAEELNLLFLNKAPFAINWVDENFQFIDCNAHTLEMFGFASKEDYRNSIPRLHPEYQPCGTHSTEKLFSLLNVAMEKGHARHEWMYKHNNGKPIPAENLFVKLETKDKTIIVNYTIDLRPIKEAMDRVHGLEIKLRKQEMDERIKLMFDSTPLMIEVWDKECNAIDCNQSNLDFWGFTEKEEYEEHIRKEEIRNEIFYESKSDIFNSRDEWNRHLEEIFESGSGKFEFVEKGPHDEPAFLEVDGVRMKHNEEIVVVTYSKDVTQLKENERTIAEVQETIQYREKLLNIANQAAELLLTANEENSGAALMECLAMVGRAFDADRASVWQYEEIDGEVCFPLRHVWLSELGQTKKQLPSDYVSYYNENPEFFDKILNGININCPASEMPPQARPYYEDFEVLSVVVLPMLLDGKIIGFFSLHDCKAVRIFSKDEINIMASVGLMITSVYYKIAQSALEKEFEQERRRTEVAEESNRAKSAFLARMSHEIRTPITAVMGISEIELQDPNLSPHLEESFAKMHNAANHLLNIVNDVLDLSKIEAGKMELLQEKYEVASMIVDAIQLNAVLDDDKDVKLNVSIDENLPAYLIGDVVRVKQIINNILSNAFKYTEAGTVGLSLHCDKETPEDDEYVTVVISIVDTGYGMTAKQLEDITDEYTRHHEREFRNIDGTGLGMPIVYSLAQMMGAEIDIDSEVGVGTSVVVRIPQKVVGSEVLGKELALNLQQFEYVMKITGKRFGIEPESMPYGSVLVVDDVDANLYVTRGLLAFYDLQIETCTNGYDAVKLIEQGNVYDMILLDHMMPGMNGTETMLRLRELGYWHPIVVLTADAIIGQAEEFIKSGFDGFISKPIQTKRLNDILIEHIKNKQPPEVIKAANALSAKNIRKRNIDSFQRSPVLLAQLRLDFAKNYGTTFSELCSSINAYDMETARRLAHTIKGAAGLLYDDALSDIANEVGQVLAKNEKPTSAQLSVLGHEMDRVLAAAAEISMPSSAEEYMDIEEALILLEEITPLLADKNVAALKMIDELRKIPQSGLLCSQLERFDFKSALETATRLKNEMGIM